MEEAKEEEAREDSKKEAKQEEATEDAMEDALEEEQEPVDTIAAPQSPKHKLIDIVKASDKARMFSISRADLLLVLEGFRSLESQSQTLLDTLNEAKKILDGDQEDMTSSDDKF